MNPGEVGTIGDEVNEEEEFPPAGVELLEEDEVVEQVEIESDGARAR